jgi:hypothetical protein
MRAGTLDAMYLSLLTTLNIMATTSTHSWRLFKASMIEVKNPSVKSLQIFNEISSRIFNCAGEKNSFFLAA